MPGLLSNMFEGRGSHADGGGPATQRWEGDGGDHHSESRTTDSDSHAAAHADPTLHIHDEMSASWDNPDGSHSSWSHSEDVNLTVDIHAAAEAGTHIGQNDFEG